MMCEIDNVISKVNNRRVSVLNFAEKVNEELFEIYGYSDVRLYRIPESNDMKIVFIVLDDESEKFVEVEYDLYTVLDANNTKELYDIMLDAIREKLNINLEI